MRDRADSFTPSDEWGSFQFTTSADAKRAEHMFNQLSSERDALKVLNAELVEALRYWLPDESWMAEKYPNHKHDAWGMFYEHAALLAKVSK